MTEARTAPTLEALRAEIDRLDAEIHDRVRRRAELVEAIGRSKGRVGNAARPGREAAILRRLAARHGGALPFAAIARIWRELIAACTALQAPFRLAVCDGMRAAKLREIARDHFGAFATTETHPDEAAVIAAAGERDDVVGVLPPPASDDRAPWWPLLAIRSDQAPRVIVRLPFVRDAGAAPAVEAMVVARVKPEPSGEDVSLIVLATKDEISHDRLGEKLTAAGLKGRRIADAAREGEVLHLLEVDGFIAADDPRLGRLTGEAVCIGAYARPIVAA
ncbi:MAG: chorismate mutase [Alphaproteobacteria bacterium]|nr:chorismate mutase [Alphaproteobacteria bacterium]